MRSGAAHAPEPPPSDRSAGAPADRSDGPGCDKGAAIARHRSSLGPPLASVIRSLCPQWKTLLLTF
eukprot:1190590-Prorocentrum_minimum.AAC.2